MIIVFIGGGKILKYEIKALENYGEFPSETKKFLFKMIKKEYGYGYIPEYHEDIKNLEEIYLDNKRNNFFIAIDNNENIVGTVAIREYDRDFEQFVDIYSKDSTASIWRVFVDVNFRRLGIASALVSKAEKFSRNNYYQKLYLHTHKNVDGALDFWKSLGYNITFDTNNELKTVHMEKSINNVIYDIRNSLKGPIAYI